MNHDQYFNRFYEILSLDISMKEAWQILEKEYMKATGRTRPRYSTYKNFSNCKRRWMKEQKERLEK